MTDTYPGGSVVKNPPANAGDAGDTDLNPGLGRSPEKGMATTLLPGEPHGQRSLVGYSLWGPKELDTTEQLSTCPTPWDPIDRSLVSPVHGILQARILE